MNKEKTKQIVEKGRAKIKILKNKQDGLMKEFIRIFENEQIKKSRDKIV